MNITHFKEGMSDEIKTMYFDSFNSPNVTVLNYLGDTVYVVSNRVDIDKVKEFFGADPNHLKEEIERLKISVKYNEGKYRDVYNENMELGSRITSLEYESKALQQSIRSLEAEKRDLEIKNEELIRRLSENNGFKSHWLYKIYKWIK